jgi:hypothetical protein
MALVFNLGDFLARSTDKTFDDTTLSKVLAGLPKVTPTGPWIAGGALRRTLLGQEPASDFDFFFQSPEQLNAFRERLEASGFRMLRETEHHLHFQGKVEGSDLPIDAQLIRFAFYADAKAVIDSFDYTICQLAFDGDSLTLGDFTLWDLGRKRLAIHKVTFPVSTMRRMLKYTRQGFYACAGAMEAILKATQDNPELRTDIRYVD